MPKLPRETPTGEILAIHGMLLHDGQLLPILASTSDVHPEPRGLASHEWSVEAIDADAKTVARGTVFLTSARSCRPITYDLRSFDARLPLPAGTKGVRILHGEKVVHEGKVGDAPTIKLTAPKVSKGARATLALGLDISKPSADALVHGALEYDDGRVRGIGAGKPQRSLRVPLDGMPPGRARLRLSYTSGLRTAVAYTRAFDVPAPEPTLIIDVEEEGEWTGRANAPIDLRGSVHDPGMPTPRAKDVEWRIGGKVVARGEVAVVWSLPEGKHDVELRYRGRSVERTLRVLPAARPKRAKPSLR